MSRPSPDPRTIGFRQAWVSDAILWSGATRRLFATNGFAEIQLAFVTYHLCLTYTSQLLGGSGAVRADGWARRSCPFQPPRLVRQLKEQVQPVRDEVLHLYEKTDTGRGLTVTWSRGSLTFSGLVGRKTATLRSMTEAEVIDTLDKLAPWLKRQYDRLVLKPRSMSK